MSANTIARLESNLSSIKSLTDAATERRFLRLVESLSTKRSPAALGALLAQVRDTEHDMMEIIMQAAEKFPLKLYATGLARELVGLHKRAPYRTSIFVSRVLQGPKYLDAVVAALEGAGPEIQEALAEMFGRIRDDRPDLARLMERVKRAVAQRRLL